MTTYVNKSKLKKISSVKEANPKLNENLKNIDWNFRRLFQPEKIQYNTIAITDHMTIPADSLIERIVVSPLALGSPAQEPVIITLPYLAESEVGRAYIIEHIYPINNVLRSVSIMAQAEVGAGIVLSYGGAVPNLFGMYLPNLIMVSSETTANTVVVYTGNTFPPAPTANVWIALFGNYYPTLDV